MAMFELLKALNENDQFHFFGKDTTVVSKDEYKKSIELVLKDSDDCYSIFLNKEDRTILHDDGFYII